MQSNVILYFVALVVYGLGCWYFGYRNGTKDGYSRGYHDMLAKKIEETDIWERS